MNLNFDFFCNSNYDNLILDVEKKNCLDIIKIISKKYKKNNNNISIFENNNLLNYKFYKWNCNNCYLIMIDNEYINIIVKVKNKIINLPQLDINTQIYEIKNILSIKDDLFFNNRKLKDNRSLKYYQIYENNILSINQAELTASVP